MPIIDIASKPTFIIFKFFKLYKALIHIYTYFDILYVLKKSLYKQPVFGYLYVFTFVSHHTHDMFQYSVEYAHTDLLISMNSNDSSVSARIGEAVLASKKKLSCFGILFFEASSFI